MKKNILLPLTAALSIVAVVLFCAAGCSKKNVGARQSEQTLLDEEGGALADIPDFEQAFVPVYEKAVPEPDLPAKKRNLSGRSASSAKKSASGATSSTVRPLKRI